MEKAMTFGRGLAIASSAAILMTAATIAASANDGEPFQEKGELPQFFESIEHDVSVNEALNTITITVTSDDAEAVEFLQSQEPRTPRGEYADEITTTQKDISNGIQVTISTQNDDAFAELVAHAEEGPHQDGKKGGHGEKPEFADEINVEEVTTDNGFQITITSENEEAVAHIQERANQEHEGREGEGEYDITKTTELIDNGVIVTVTAGDADSLEHLQERAEKGFERGPRGGHQGEDHEIPHNHPEEDDLLRELN